jgi:hypothetical protein
VLFFSKTYTTKVKNTVKWNTETAAKKTGRKYPTKQINNNNNNNNNNDVPNGTKDKVYSAVVSPNNKCLPDDGPCAAETCSKNNEYT